MIRVENITVSRSGRPVLERLSFAVGHGERVAVVGANGSGKSTLLLALAGGIPPSAGRVSFGDATRIGYVPSHLAAWPVVRADEFLEFCGASLGMSGKPLRVAVSRGLAMAGLGDRPAIRLDGLSDGMRKRLLVARALLDDPEVLLMDDPFSSLDGEGQAMVTGLVEDFGLAGGVVLAAINSGRVERCWSRFVTLADGRIRDGAAS